LTRQENLVTDSSVLNIGVQSIIMATKLAAPMLGVSLGIGLFIGLIQSATQIQEQTLTFVPKLAGVAIVIIIMGNWMLSQLVTFTHQLFQMIPQLLQ
jgi:flagellar biosynthetic protein FliQ